MDRRFKSALNEYAGRSNNSYTRLLLHRIGHRNFGHQNRETGPLAAAIIFVVLVLILSTVSWGEPLHRDSLELAHLPFNGFSFSNYFFVFHDDARLVSQLEAQIDAALHVLADLPRLFLWP